MVGVRLDAPLANAVFTYFSYHKISNQSFGVKKLIKLGIQTDLIIRGVDPIVHDTPLEMQTTIDLMTPEQREKLLSYLIQKMGIKEIAHIRSLENLK